MATTVSQGTNVTAATTALPVLFPAVGSYSYTQETPGESIYTNAVNAIDQPNSIRASVSTIKDIFAKTGIMPIPGQCITGKSTLTQNFEAWKVVDDGGGLYNPVTYYLPVQIRTVISYPDDPWITDAMITALYGRNVGAMLRAVGDLCGTQQRKLARGIVRP